ncbi:NADPH-dependent FMN reductase [Jonesia quinghaiensis]|uniref:NADPH-dependent FMN reductase n=1 Tax=Jonesia quinghaiensis TaxID=262806 RepID=UPI0004292C11|nr:NAD(P)H-dependent oxidoreductase [Jonesia quinghaiensis]
MTVNIGYIVGSISSTSINRRVFEALRKLAPEGVEINEIPIADLPMYSPDFDGAYPEAAAALKKSVEAADAVIISTPQYNDSFSGAVKNAVDWASRPWGQHSFSGKPTAVASASIAPHGGAKAGGFLADILAFGQAKVLETHLNVFVNDDSFTDDGSFAQPELIATARDYINAVVDHSGASSAA